MTANKLNDLRQCGRLHRFTTIDDHDGFAVDVCFAGCFSDSYLRDSLSGFFVGNQSAVTGFRAPEIHHTHVVALLPAAGCLFANVAVNIGNDVSSP
jgi:hypothetical protein